LTYYHLIMSKIIMSYHETIKTINQLLQIINNQHVLCVTDITMSERQEIAANAIVLSWSNKSVITLNKVKMLGVQVF